MAVQLRAKTKKWSPDEVDELRRLYGTITYSEIAARMGRNRNSVRNKSLAEGLARKRQFWTGAELTRLRRLKAQGASSDELLAAFPERTLHNLHNIAWRYKLNGAKPRLRSTEIAVLDQIRSRAFDLKYTMHDLDEMVQCRRYFANSEYINARAIAAAAKALGGELYAVWS